MAVGFPTKANWAAGDVLTASAQDDLAGTVNLLSNASAASGSQLVSNVAGTSFAYQATPSASNPVLNSAMQIWQRGTSAVGSTTAFAGDRWQAYRNTTGSTYSRQVTNDTTNLPFIQYCTRVQRDATTTATNGINLSQTFETVNSIPFAGKTVTASFYARAGSNFSSASNIMALQGFTGTGTDQNFWSGFTGQSTAVNQNFTLTTTWQRFTVSFALGSTATQFAFLFTYSPVGTAGTNDYFEVTGVQIDIGSVALPFRTYAATLQGELAACQRYFFNMVTGNTLAIGNGTYFNSTNLIGIAVRYPVSMRVAPTLINTFGTNYYAAETNGGTDFLDTILFRRASVSTGELYNNSEASGVQGYGASVLTNNASSSISFNAEL
jgi:hypothetical protein